MAKKQFTLKRQKLNKNRRKMYMQEQADFSSLFGEYSQAVISRRMDVGRFKSLMRADLRRYYIRLALLGKGGRSLTGHDRSDLGLFLAKAYGHLDGFVADLSEQYRASDAQVEARARSYGYGWGVYNRFTIPAAIADLLPALPGLDCLGQDRCGCWIEFSVHGQTAEVYWLLNPSKLHCVVCSDFGASWAPLILELPDREDMDEEDWLDIEDW